MVPDNATAKATITGYCPCGRPIFSSHLVQTLCGMCELDNRVTTWGRIACTRSELRYLASRERITSR